MANAPIDRISFHDVEPAEGIIMKNSALQQHLGRNLCPPQESYDAPNN